MAGDGTSETTLNGKLRQTNGAFIGICLLAILVIGCRSGTAVGTELPSEARIEPVATQDLLREVEWLNGHTFRVDEDVTVELPDPDKVYWGGGWTALIKHVPSESSVRLRRGFAELMLPDGTVQISETSEALFGQRFEIGRDYKSKEVERKLDAALHDPVVMSEILSSRDPDLSARVTREEAIRIAFDAFRGGQLHPRFTPMEEPRDPLFILIRWGDMKQWPGGDCDGYVIGPGRHATVPFSRTKDTPVWFVQFQARSRSVSSGYEFTWSNAVIDAETGRIEAECRTNEPRRVEPIVVVTIQDADPAGTSSPTRDE